MLHGIDVTLWTQTPNGVDEFNRVKYTETAELVSNVLVAPMSDTEVLDTLNLTGRKAVYQLGLPKGDLHEWENHRVSFFGEDWRVIGVPTEGIEEMIPLEWNKKVKVERYGEKV